MGQVTIYLDDLTEKKMKAAAKKDKLSKSKWIAKLIESKVNDEWSMNVRELAGAWDVFSESDEQRASLGKDVDRETF